MTVAQPARRLGRVNVVEINPHAPRPFVFTDLAQCLRDSIQAAGFESNLYVNYSDITSISLVLGAVPPHLAPLDGLDPARTVIVNFEQLASNSPVATPEYRRWLGRWLVADYHSRNIDYLKRENGPAQQILELPVVPGPSLAFPAADAAGKTVDVLFFGTLTARRAEIIRRLEAAGMSVETISGAYGHELAPAIRRARIVLHVHYYDTGLFPVARVLQPVANDIPVVCETSVFSSHSDWSQSGVVFAEYDALVNACQALLGSSEDRVDRVRLTRAFVSRLDFATPFQLLLQTLSAMPGPSRPATERAEPPPTPAPLQPPRGSQAQPSPLREHEGDEQPLSTAEIEAILERETRDLPPDAQASASPVELVTRRLGQGRLGRWAVWLLIAFSLATVWQSMR